MSVRGSALFLLCLLICLFTAPVQSQPPGSTTAFVDVNVVPMKDNGVLAHQTVIIRHGRITVCDDMKKVVVPEDAVRIEARGRYLLPGLADMHVHLHTPEDALLLLANGVTTVRNMRGMPHHLAWKKKIDAGEMLAPRLFTCGPTLDGVPPSSDNITVVETPEEGRQQVRDQKAAGYDCIKVYTRLSRPVYDAIMDEAKKLQIPVSGHVPTNVGLEHVLEMHQQSIEHLTGYMAALKKGTAADPDEIPTVVRASQLNGVWNCVTLVVQHKLTSPPSAQSLAHMPELQYLPKSRVLSWLPSNQKQLATVSEEEFAAARRGLKLLEQLTKALNDAHTGILLGTDAPSRYVVPGFSIHEELQYLTEAGLSPYEAIRAGTVNAAEYLKSDF
jgi:imidazolonepropionase-like amidohydrolase